jgi:short-subunit dehydrogenase
MKKALVIGPGKNFGELLITKLSGENFEVHTISQSSTFPNAGYSYNIDISAQDFLGCLLKIVEKHSKFNCLIFNVKNSTKGNLSQVAVDQLDGVYKAMVRSLFVLAQNAEKILTQDSKFIVTGGGFAFKPNSNQFTLSLAKACQNHIVEMSKNLLKSQGVTMETVIVDGKIGMGKGEIKPDEIVSQIMIKLGLYKSLTVKNQKLKDFLESDWFKNRENDPDFQKLSHKELREKYYKPKGLL